VYLLYQNGDNLGIIDAGGGTVDWTVLSLRISKNRVAAKTLLKEQGTLRRP
jgi:hypothetical protein